MNRRTPSESGARHDGRVAARNPQEQLAAIAAVRLGLALIVVPWLAVVFLLLNDVGDWPVVVAAAAVFSVVGAWIMRWAGRQSV